MSAYDLLVTLDEDEVSQVFYTPFRQRIINTPPLSTSAPLQSVNTNANYEGHYQAIENIFHFSRFHPNSAPMLPQQPPSGSSSRLIQWGESKGRGVKDSMKKLCKTLNRMIQDSSEEEDDEVNDIIFTVFKSDGGIPSPILEIPDDGFFEEAEVSKDEFLDIINEIKSVIVDFPPELINKGSSGSYFIKVSNEHTIGVFKPKDEEPYGPMTPKWNKWIHRNFFPCLYGRSCLIPNISYLSECAAYILDVQLQSFIVPYTDVTKLASRSFHHPNRAVQDPSEASLKAQSKQGSFQFFLHGYQDANKFFELYPIPDDISLVPDIHEFVSNHPDDDPEFRWTQQVLGKFKLELEKLIILDYIMRNTDRSLQNWMIGVDWRIIRVDPKTSRVYKLPHIKIGAIDSGLSFPWKHPDSWRSYPFGWLFLASTLISQPFTQNSRNHYLKLLTSKKWWEVTTKLLKKNFQRDEDFNERMWDKQLQVLKGQALNVVETLKSQGHGPLELVRRAKILVKNEIIEVPVSFYENTHPYSGSITHHSFTNVSTANNNLNSPAFFNPLTGTTFESEINTSYLRNENEYTPLVSPQTRIRSSKKVIMEIINTVEGKDPVFSCC
ncbi:hypothetical protein WICPIJ_006882 [Wickerhamomyces pijperi]|uniref:Phosphatidylinositol 4-kinase n=1 Tax=Wickerhamomyces pijperi TaxID=599730 RepID=A0A9P8Q1A4_WICPI|nr:hypothetical protein WICPIJ_006882 [Wickerhamomyces pijperi]